MSGIMDERSIPPLRTVIGDLFARSTCADIAVANIRLAALDLSPGEVRSIRRCRILLGRLDARALSDGPPGDTALDNVRVLLQFIESEFVQIRSAGRASWTPDFSLFRDAAGQTVCLIGAHYFREPVAASGPSLTCALADPVGVDLIARRFEELWEIGYDVRDAVAASVREWMHAGHVLPVPGLGTDD